MDEKLDLTESVSGVFPTYSYTISQYEVLHARMITLLVYIF